MSPIRTAVIHQPRHSTVHRHRKGRSSGVGPIRPRDLAVRPDPPRVPTTPTERFTAALLDGDRLGLDSLAGNAHLSNVTVDISIEEQLGEIEDIYQDPSLWTLVILLKPDMFMTPLRIPIAEYKGDQYAIDAPTWLVRLIDIPGRYKTCVRSYRWIMAFVVNLLTTPFTRVPRAQKWADLLQYVGRIKEVCEMAHRTPHDPSRPLPKPRPRRSCNTLVAPMAALSLDSAKETEPPSARS